MSTNLPATPATASPEPAPRPLTCAELDALPLGERVGYRDRGGFPRAAVKIGTRPSSGAERFSITGPTLVGSFELESAGAVLLEPTDPPTGTADPDGERALTRFEATDRMTMWWDETLWLPFVESENCDITGPGHQDPAAFAALVTAYDRHATGDPDVQSTPADVVRHRWIRVVATSPDDWRAETVPADHPDAIAVTTVWGVR